jgi:hypothetical protein
VFQDAQAIVFVGLAVVVYPTLALPPNRLGLQDEYEMIKESTGLLCRVKSAPELPPEAPAVTE